jgi:hypothetical protein
MKQVLDSLKAEFITINDDDSGKKYVVRVWHLQLAAFVIGWLIG